MELRQGYKQTEVGVIPKDWEVKAVKSLNFDISDGNYSSKYPKASDFRPTGVPFIRANNVRNMKVVDDDMRFISIEQHRELLKGHLKKNDVLITTRGEIGQIALVPDCHIDSNINAQIVRINTSNQPIDYRFLAYSLSSESSQEQLKNLETGSALKQLPVGKLVLLILVVPPLPEQRAIAAALSDVDALLAKLDALIAKKRDLKQAAMQQLLTGQTRLPGFSGAWEVKRLGEVADVDPENLSSNTQPNYAFNYISLEDVDFGVLRSYSEQLFSTSPSRARRSLQKGDVLVSTVRPNLKSHLLFNIDATNWVCSTGFSVVRCRDGLTHPGYVFMLFFGHKIMRQIDALLTGSNYPAINGGDVRTLEIPVPEYKEQAAIAEVLSDMDAEIAALEARRDKTLALKQGMMQELLTGRIRLV